MSISIATLVTAVNDHDLDAMIALLHPDYRSLQPVHPARAFVGSAQVRANWAAVFAGVPDFRAELGRVVQHGETQWCEWGWSGTRTDGQPFAVRGVALFEASARFDGRVAPSRARIETPSFNTQARSRYGR
ncbi:MAG: nuclear transport factor 2 family protein [Actinomycetota bacterium]